MLRKSGEDRAAVIAAGVTLFEALEAYEVLKKEGILIRVIDLYSIKPIDAASIREAALATRCVVTVEDHFPEGGLGEAVQSALAGVCVPVHSLAVRKKPMSGKPEELLDFEEISRKAIVQTVKEKIGNR